MAERAEESGALLPQERFEGEIRSAMLGVALPAKFELSADASGALALELEPVATSAQAVELLADVSGAAGTRVVEFGISGKSTAGKEFKSDRVQLAGWGGGAKELNLRVAVSDGTLTWRGETRRDGPALGFFLRGFECYSVVRATHALGTVSATGPMRARDVTRATGKLVVEATSVVDVQSWRADAETLLQHVRSVLAFSRGAHLPVPILQFSHYDQIEIRFMRAAAGVPSMMPVFHHLNLQPAFDLAVRSHEAVTEDRDGLATAIGWTLVRTTYDEVRLLVGMTALEALAAHLLSRGEKQILSTGRFKRLQEELRSQISARSDLSDDEKAAIKSKLPELKRFAFREVLDKLLAKLDISRVDIESDAIDNLVRTRNRIVHEGGTEGRDLWPQILCVREILARLVLCMLKFEGRYLSYHGEEGQHWREFPSCSKAP